MRPSHYIRILESMKVGCRGLKEGGLVWVAPFLRLSISSGECYVGFLATDRYSVRYRKLYLLVLVAWLLEFTCHVVGVGYAPCRQLAL